MEKTTFRDIRLQKLKIQLTFCFHDRKQEVVHLLLGVYCLVQQHPSSAQMFNTRAHECPLFLARGPSAHGLLFGAAFTVVTAGGDGGRV